MKRDVARLTLITLGGISMVFTGWLVKTSAVSQAQERTVIRKSWRQLNPARVVAVKTKNKADVALGKPFADDDNWLEGFAITVANDYDKTITALTVEMVFRREPGDSRPPFAKALHFGPSPSGPEYARRDRTKVIKSGQSVELVLSSGEYQNLKRTLEELGYPQSVKRVALEITEVGFEDGSVVRGGTLFLPDPQNPDSPERNFARPAHALRESIRL